MGMSNDFEAAIEEGATLIRIGTACSEPALSRSTRGLCHLPHDGIPRTGWNACRISDVGGFLAGQASGTTPSMPRNLEQLGRMIPMQDGVHLAADVFLPRSSGRWPTVLFRTPYGRKGPSGRSYRGFLQRGYAVVIEDARGRCGSQGVFGTIEQEGPDGSDTINWIAASPGLMRGLRWPGVRIWAWCNGGPRSTRNPHLFAIAPVVSGDDEYTDRFYSTGGALKHGHRLLWLTENVSPPLHPRPLFNNYIGHLPLILPMSPLRTDPPGLENRARSSLLRFLLEESQHTRTRIADRCPGPFHGGLV